MLLAAVVRAVVREGMGREISRAVTWALVEMEVAAQDVVTMVPIAEGAVAVMAVPTEV